MSSDPRTGLQRLRAAAESGALDALCERHGIWLMSVFGSATRPGREPEDLDVAIAKDDSAGLFAIIEDLVLLTGTEAVDLLDLRTAGAVARERALVGAVALYERRAGDYARAQAAAMVERMDTDWLRRLDLELMAE